MSKKSFPPLKKWIIIYLLLLGIITDASSQKNYGKLDIQFYFTVNDKKLFLNDSIYINQWGEQYNISKVKMLIGKMALDNLGRLFNNDSYFLIDAAKQKNSIEIKVPAGKYHQFNFLLGVDSIDNCSGAQKGALDPINDMFWTWNSGYIFFKLEGNSSASSSDLSRIQYHIGGYKKNNTALKHISLQQEYPFKNIIIEANKTTEIAIQINIDSIWKGNSDIKIRDCSVCMSPGSLSQKIASNFASLFSIKKIQIVN